MYVSKNLQFLFFHSNFRAHEEHRVSPTIFMFFSNVIINNIFKGDAGLPNFISVPETSFYDFQKSWAQFYMNYILDWFAFYAQVKYYQNP